MLTFTANIFTMKYLFFLLCFPALCLSQKKQPQTTFEIQYVKSYNGKVMADQDTIVIFTNARQTIISPKKVISGKAEFPYEQSFIDRKSETPVLVQTAALSKSRQIETVDSISITKQTFEFLPETKKILGYNCKKAKTIINSNTIEIWYTDELKVKGAPSALGQNLGLVLETIRNGNFAVSAIKVKKSNGISDYDLKRETVDALTFRDLIWKSKFTTIPVFKNETINFSGESKSDENVMRFASGTIIVKKIKLPEIKNGSQIFVDVTEQSSGDAYDRTGSVFLIPTDNTVSFMDALQSGIKSVPVYDNGNGKQYQGVVRTSEYSPLLEVMRFFTPFGVKGYNHIQLKNRIWQDSAYYRQDISELLPALSNKEVYIGMNIGNYDKGGHKASLNITIHPEESKKPETVLFPIFNTNNVMEMANQEYGTMFSSEKGLEVTFNLPKDLKNVKLRYITTGHGGWENGDEFVPKKNTIFLDGKLVFDFAPWRTDCGSYRLTNPASGNFENGLSSSDYSRSNWCPGTVTNPFYIDLGDLKAGNHTIQVKIPLGASEGNMFSAWNVSGVLIGE